MKKNSAKIKKKRHTSWT